MSEAVSHVIVGAGEAGVQAALSLRREGFGGGIVLVGREPHAPYSRPPLSKAVLTAPEPALPSIATGDLLREKAIDFRPDTCVRAIDVAAHAAVLQGGERIVYERLVLATGCRPRRLRVGGDAAEEVLYLRSYDDALALRSRLKEGCRMVLIGGGYIGLELAAAGRQRGCTVTVLEQAPMVMARAVGSETAKYFTALHSRHGVEIRTGVRVEGVHRHGGGLCVRTHEGMEVEADLVVAGIGAEPRVELARAAGLLLDDGVVVDEFGRSSEPDIFACGDVANHPNAHLGRRLRLESWQNAQQQAACVAATLAGKPRAYTMVPWFWSEQYGVNLQVVGAPARWDQTVVRGSMAEDAFTVIYLDAGVVVAANSVNRPRDIAPIRSAIARRARGAAPKLSDTSIELPQALKD